MFWIVWFKNFQKFWFLQVKFLLEPYLYINMSAHKLHNTYKFFRSGITAQRTLPRIAAMINCVAQATHTRSCALSRFVYLFLFPLFSLSAWQWRARIERRCRVNDTRPSTRLLAQKSPSPLTSHTNKGQLGKINVVLVFAHFS